MLAYRVQMLSTDDDEAEQRILAALVARKHRAIFEVLPRQVREDVEPAGAVAEGRLQPCGVVMLAEHLTPDNACQVLAGAPGRTEAELEQWIASRFGTRPVSGLAQHQGE
jgi:hypothetical protein